VVPFAIAAATPLLLTLLFGPGAGSADFIASAVLTVLLIGVALWFPWDRVPAPLYATVPLAYFAVVFLLRDSSPAATQLYTLLVLLPVIWLALYGTRARLIAAFVLLALTLVLPILVIGPPRYPTTEWRRVAIYLLIAPIVGITIQRLVAATRERAERLRASEAAIASVLRASTEHAIIGTNPDGVITTFNTGAERMLGYTASEMIGVETPATFHDREEIAQRARELGMVPGFEVVVAAARRGESETRDWSYIRKDGRRLTVAVSVTAIQGPEVEPDGFICVAYDVTLERTRATTRERELAVTQQARQQLTEQNARLAEIEGRLRTLLETGIAISSELSIDALLQRIVEAAARLTDAKYAALATIDRTGTGLERFVTTGIDEETQAAIGHLPVGRGILGVVIGDALRLHDLGKDPRSVGFPPNHPPMRTFLGTPIRLHDVTYGNIYLTEKAGGADFGEEDEELVTLLAGQAAVAIENARLFEAGRLIRSRQERLQMVTDIALAHPELDDLLGVLLPMIRELLAADTCVLFLLDEKSQELVVRAAVYADPDLEDDVIGRVRIPIGQYVVGRVAAEGKHIVVEDVEHTTDLHPIVYEIGIKSLCYVPLLLPGKVVGVLHVGTLSPRVFTDDDIELLGLAADRAAMAIVHASLFQAKRETAETLERTNEELRRLDQMKDLFVSGVSHELRTPLTSMLAYLEILLDGEVGELSDAQKQFLEVVDRNCHRLTDLIDDILFVSRLDSGRFQLERASVDAGELVADRVESIRPSAEKKRVALRLDVSDGVPQLWADRSRLAQVVDNLLSNAVKFTPEGGDVFLTVSASGDTAHLEVRDTGVGIPEDDAKRLFERFFRASTAQNIQGTGLGLSIAKTIVEAHGGAISVRSRAGVGTTFCVDLPLVTEPTAVDESAIEATT
jgi:PAS domain S-box-containing protein